MFFQKGMKRSKPFILLGGSFVVGWILMGLLHSSEAPPSRPAILPSVESRLPASVRRPSPPAGFLKGIFPQLNSMAIAEIEDFINHYSSTSPWAAAGEDIDFCLRFLLRRYAEQSRDDCLAYCMNRDRERDDLCIKAYSCLGALLLDGNIYSALEIVDEAYRAGAYLTMNLAFMKMDEDLRSSPLALHQTWRDKLIAIPKSLNRRRWIDDYLTYCGRGGNLLAGDLRYWLEGSDLSADEMAYLLSHDARK
jgi:hypothetical protein